jgi:hypothetical protein
MCGNAYALVDIGIFGDFPKKKKLNFVLVVLLRALLPPGQTRSRLTCLFCLIQKGLISNIKVSLGFEVNTARVCLRGGREKRCRHGSKENGEY